MVKIHGSFVCSAHLHNLEINPHHSSKNCVFPLPPLHTHRNPHLQIVNRLNVSHIKKRSDCQVRHLSGYYYSQINS